jgi:hypothetical protein
MKNIIIATISLALSASAFAADNATAATEGRPAIIRMGSVCYQPTGDDLGPQVPCDDRYSDAERIAGVDWFKKNKLKNTNSPGARADWEAWQATTGIASYNARLEAYAQERAKQGAQHADAAKPFLSGICEQGHIAFSQDPDLSSCEFEVSEFERNYWLAMQGDYEAQLSVGGCFKETAYRADPIFRWPCRRVVRADEAMMCAWYLVAMSSGHVKGGGEGDAAEKFGYVYECDKKPWAVRQSMLGTATALFNQIYHRPLPLAGQRGQ